MEGKPKGAAHRQGNAKDFKADVRRLLGRKKEGMTIRVPLPRTPHRL